MRTGGISRRASLLTGLAALAAPVGSSAQSQLQPVTSPWTDIYYDPLGLIVQRDGDGGDTAQREGWAWFGSWLLEKKLGGTSPFKPPKSFQDTMDMLEVGRTGQFRRHPTQADFRSDPNAFSRDQLIPLIAALAVQSDVARIQRSYDARRPCHLVLTCVQGTADVIDPSLLGHYQRGLNQSVDSQYDTAMAAGVAVRLLQAGRDPDDVGDDLNTLIYLLTAQFLRPSVTMTLTRNYYAKNRPVSSGCFLSSYRNKYPNDYGADEASMKARIAAGRAAGWQPDCPSVLGALRWYFRVESGGCPGLAELYAPIVRAWVS